MYAREWTAPQWKSRASRTEGAVRPQKGNCVSTSSSRTAAASQHRDAPRPTVRAGQTRHLFTGHLPHAVGFGRVHGLDSAGVSSLRAAVEVLRPGYDTARGKAGSNSNDICPHDRLPTIDLFFAGIGSHFDYRSIRYGLAGFGGALLVVAIAAPSYRPEPRLSHPHSNPYFAPSLVLAR